MKNILKVYDTSALLSLSDNLVLDSTCYVSTLVINELENIKTSFNKDLEVKAQARQVVRILKSSAFTSNLINHATIERMVRKYRKVLPDNTDSRILLEAYSQIRWYDEVKFYTNDLTLFLFASHLFKHKKFSAHLTGDITKKRFWDGYVVIYHTAEEWANLYDENIHDNFFNL